MINVCKTMHTQKMFLPQFKNQKELDWENEYNCRSGGQPEGRVQEGEATRCGRGTPRGWAPLCNAEKAAEDAGQAPWGRSGKRSLRS